MTYLQFHLVFIAPVLLVLGALAIRKPPTGVSGRRAAVSLVAITAIALAYTTPWDNYLVASGIWKYGNDRVIGTIGYVPIEEYLFFLLQPLLVGCWLYLVLRRPRWSEGSRFPRTVRLVGAGLFLILALAGVILFRIPGGEYMGLILFWACPILAGMWAWQGPSLWRFRSVLLWAVIPPTVYLWIADRIAIGLGIWWIEPATSLGISPLGLPIEEAVFFLVTNLLSVLGLALLINIWNLLPAHAMD